MCVRQRIAAAVFLQAGYFFLLPKHNSVQACVKVKMLFCMLMLWFTVTLLAFSCKILKLSDMELPPPFLDCYFVLLFSDVQNLPIYLISQ